MSTSLSGRILTPDGFVDGRSRSTNQGRVDSITGTPVALEAARDTQAALILPGFIDLHVHGGGGHDVMEGGDAAQHIAALHVRHGTTSMLRDDDDLRRCRDIETAFAALAPLLRAGSAAQREHTARILGVHLEGPYINPCSSGPSPTNARPLNGDEIGRLHALAPIRLITLAPEVAGNIDVDRGAGAGWLSRADRAFAGELRRGGQRSRARCRRLHALVQRDERAAPREPGVVGAALAHAKYSEIIPTCCTCTPARSMWRCARSHASTA